MRDRHRLEFHSRRGGLLSNIERCDPDCFASTCDAAVAVCPRTVTAAHGDSAATAVGIHDDLRNITTLHFHAGLSRRRPLKISLRNCPVGTVGGGSQAKSRERFPNRTLLASDSSIGDSISSITEGPYISVQSQPRAPPKGWEKENKYGTY